MPRVQIKTVESIEGWKSDDGKIISYDVTVDVNGKKAEARTFSKAISEVGFEGEVESYEKNNHTYLKQPQRENSYSNYNKGYAAKDNSDGQRQGMCIKTAGDYIIHSGGFEGLKPEEFAHAVHSYAKELYKIDLKSPVSDIVIEDISTDVSKGIDDVFGKV